MISSTTKVKLINFYLSCLFTRIKVAKVVAELKKVNYIKALSDGKASFRLRSKTECFVEDKTFVR